MHSCFGLALVDDHVTIVEGEFHYYFTCSFLILLCSVITMYEKSGGKGARHSWTSLTTSIGALSYLAVQCYQNTWQSQFWAMECVVTRTTRFTLLSSLAFLCIVPQGMVHRSTSNHFIELHPGSFEDIFKRVYSEKNVVLVAVRGLLKPPRANKHLVANMIEDADD